MNKNPQTPITEEQADGLFTAFFHAKRPQNWRPAPQPWNVTPVVTPNTPELPVAHRDTMLKSRLTLAASVALLIGGCWYLSGHVTNGKKVTPSSVSGEPVADKKILDDIKGPPKLPKNK